LRYATVLLCRQRNGTEVALAGIAELGGEFLAEAVAGCSSRISAIGTIELVLIALYDCASAVALVLMSNPPMPNRRAK